jgi:sodium/potassium-transporting ATPase subunit alpha
VASIPLPLSTVLILCVDLGTDMFPAISFAHESKEADIMLRKPRNSKTDHLVDWNLIRWAYGQSGMIQTAAGFYSYFVVLYEYGLTLGMLYNLDRSQHFAKQSLVCFGKSCEYFDADDFCSNPANAGTFAGADVCLSPDAQQQALGEAQTAFFVAIVICQLANVLICKTRKLSIFTKGFNNDLMVFGIVFEFGLCCLLCYAEPFQKVFGTRALTFKHWCLPLPWFIIIIVWDESRKWMTRKWPNGTLTRITYY